MGYLNKETVTVDAILTKKGRELLARGRSAFQITQFAVSDDEIDYSLYDPAHPLGTQFYGSAIENMPIVEASPDETQSMRYKLVTLSRGQNTIPQIQVQPSSIQLTYSSTSTPSADITATTTQGLNALPFGYTAILYNGNAATITGNGLGSGTATLPVFVGDSISATSVAVTGTKFTITPKNVTTTTTTQIVIVGNQTGATISIPVTIRPESTV